MSNEIHIPLKGKGFNISTLPVGEQDDSCLCGVFAWNALAAYFMPAQYELATLKTLVAQWIDLLQKILIVHLANEVSCGPFIHHFRRKLT
jgi:hypothetical protein